VTELRPLRESDLAALSTWLPQAAAALGCERWPDDAALRSAVGRDGALAIVEGDAAGVVSYRLGTPQPDAAEVSFLAVAPDRRRLGIGGRAALALEERLGGSAARVYVSVPAQAGLALYFWLRLGYRPLTQVEWPARPARPPAAWLVRELG